jgi:hypothetical protein
MPNSGYFDTKRDIEIEKAGGFWCHTCLVSHPATEQSPDPRYCQGCYEFLLKEAEVLSESGSTRRPGWIPKPQKAQENQCPIPSPGASIMATVESPKIKVAIITPRDATRTIIKRGPKHRADLPVEFILKWAGEGMGSKKITAKLKAEYDITVGFRTIARILSGQRLLV